MAGLFSKGGTPLTPAQLQQQQAAIEQERNATNVWGPVQQYFAHQTMANSPGLQEMGAGQAAAAARAAGTTAMLRGLGGDVAGSGGFFNDLGSGGNAAAAQLGRGLVDATAAGQRQYVQGLQTILGIGQADQSNAMHGLQEAANAQAQEAGAAMQGDQSSRQSAGQMIGLIAMMA